MVVGRRWEDMESDCLVNIFHRLGLDDLVLGPPFTCKSWLAASRQPSSSNVLDFRALDFMPWSQFAKSLASRYSLSGFSRFFRFIIGRSSGCVVELRLPFMPCTTMEDLVYASIKCPKLKVLVLPSMNSEGEKQIPQLVGRWKDLERLEMESKPSCFAEMASQIGLQCKSFTELQISGAIKKEDASVIVDHLPKIKNLDMSRSFLRREELLTIMKGCKELQRLIVRDCIGFEADDEVLERGLGIRTFDYQGSKLKDESGYETEEGDPHYVHVL